MTDKQPFLNKDLPPLDADELDRLRRYVACNGEEHIEARLLDTIAYKHNKLMDLTAAVRRHRDERGDDRCWMDDERLYKALPEGYTTPERSEAVELEYCKRFIATRHHPCTTYVSPQVRITELEAEVAKLKSDVVANLPEPLGDPCIDYGDTTSIHRLFRRCDELLEIIRRMKETK